MVRLAYFSLVFFLMEIHSNHSCLFTISVKSMGTAKHYLFRVMSHGTDGTTVSTSDELKYDLPDNVKQKAVTAGLIGKENMP